MPVVVGVVGGVQAILTEQIPGPSGALASPTGTGFIHVTSAAIDGVARAVNLSTADVTGLLPVTSVASPTGVGVVLVNSGWNAAASIGSAFQLMRTNSGATNVEWGAVNLASTNAITGLLPLANLTPGSNGQVMVTSAGSAAWASSSTIGITSLTGDVTGTGPGATATTVVAVNGASVPVSGALTTGNVLQVTGASALGYAAVNLAGGAGFVAGALPLANVAHGTAGQVLVTNAGATAPAWVTASQDATLTAAGAFTVTQAQAGAITFASGTGLISFALGDTAPGLSQVTAGSGVTPVNLTITPQAPNAGSATTASGTPGSLVVAWGTPVSTGTEPGLLMTRGGVSRFLLAPINAGAYNGIWFGAAAGAPLLSNYAFLQDQSDTFVNLNATTVQLCNAGTPALTITSTQIAGNAGANWSVNANAGSYGGGVGVLALANATTQPTTAPSGVVLSSSSGNLVIYDSSGSNTNIGGGSITTSSSMALTTGINANISINPASVTTGSSGSLTMHAGNSSLTSGTGGALTVSAGNETGTTSTGGAATFQSGSGTTAGGVTLLSSGNGTTYGALGVVSSGTTPGLLKLRGPACTQTQAVGGGGKATLNVATGSFVFFPVVINDILTGQIIIAI